MNNNIVFSNENNAKPILKDHLINTTRKKFIRLSQLFLGSFIISADLYILFGNIESQQGGRYATIYFIAMVVIGGPFVRLHNDNRDLVIRWLLKYGKETEGIITGVVVQPFGLFRTKQYTLQYSFYDNDKHTTYNSKCLFSERYDDGFNGYTNKKVLENTKIKVLYDPDDPQKCMLPVETSQIKTVFQRIFNKPYSAI
jgi:hypothetical protein